MEGGVGGAYCHPLLQPTHATLKKNTHYSAMPLLVRTAIFFFQFVCCTLKEDREKTIYRSELWVIMRPWSIIMQSNTVFTRQSFSFPIEILPVFLEMQNIEKYQGKVWLAVASGTERGGGGGVECGWGGGGACVPFAYPWIRACQSVH